MDNKVTYKIDAIDKITPVYRTLIGLQNKAARSVTQTNSGINEANRSMNQLANTTSQAGARITNATRYGVLRFQRVRRTVEDTNTSVRRTGSSLDWLSRRVQGVEMRASMMGNRMIGAFRGVTNMLGPMGTALAGILSFEVVKQGVNIFTEKASDLNESINKSKVVFGSNFDQISKFAENAAKSIGMSKQQALESTSTFADMFQGMGMGLNKSTKFSEGMVRLAADLGSFHNLSNEDAIAAISSGIRGEMEPLTRVGVVLNDATLKQKAFEMGLISSTKNAMSPAIKAEATIAALIEKTSRAQGDRARTSGDLAAKEKTLLSLQSDMQATLGQKLLPLKLKFVNSLIKVTEWVTNNANAVINWGQKAIYLSGALIGVYAAAKTIIGVAAFYNTVTEAMTLLRQTSLYTAVAQKVLAASNVIATLATSGLARAMVLAKIQTIAFNIVAAVSPFAWIGLVIGGIILLVKHWDKVKIYLAKFAEWVWQNHPFRWMIDLIDRVFPGFKNNLASMFESIKKVFLDVVGWIYDNVLKPLFGWLGELVDGFSFDAKPTVTPQLTSGGGDARKGLYSKKDDAYDYGGLLGGASNLGGGEGKTGKGKGGVKDSMEGLVSGGGKEMKNINIRIDKLIESFTVSTETFGLSANQIKSEVQKILLSAVNEVNYQ
jgi:hypothetical protein